MSNDSWFEVVFSAVERAYGWFERAYLPIEHFLSVQTERLCRIVEWCSPRPIKIPEGVTPDELIVAMQFGSFVRKVTQGVVGALTLWGLYHLRGPGSSPLYMSFFGVTASVCGIVLGVLVGVKTASGILKIVAAIRGMRTYPARAPLEIIRFVLIVLGLNLMIVSFLGFCPSYAIYPAFLAAVFGCLATPAIMAIRTFERLKALAQ